MRPAWPKHGPLFGSTGSYWLLLAAAGCCWLLLAGPGQLELGSEQLLSQLAPAQNSNLSSSTRSTAFAPSPKRPGIDREFVLERTMLELSPLAFSRPPSTLHAPGASSSSEKADPALAIGEAKCRMRQLAMGGVLCTASCCGWVVVGLSLTGQSLGLHLLLHSPECPPEGQVPRAHAFM